MIKLSIIVPVYNNETYLRDCLDSICSSRKPFELIIIDDGSTDATAKICKDYVNMDNRIKYYKKNNGGVSSARNYGLKKVTGDYVMFVDSDDIVVDGWDSIIDLDDSMDIYYCCKDIKETSSRDSLLRYIMGTNSEHLYLSGVVSKVFKKELINKNNIVFDECLINGEDMLFNVEAFLCAKSFKILNCQFYLYRQMIGQTTRRFDYRIIETDRRFHKKLHTLFVDAGYNEDKAYDIERYSLTNAIVLILTRLSFAKKYSIVKKYYLELENEPYCSLINSGKFVHSEAILRLCKKRRYRSLYLLFKIRNNLSIIARKLIKKEYNRI